MKYFKFMEKCNLAYAHLRGILCSLSSSWTWTGILIIGIHRGRKNLIAKHIHIWSQLPGWPCPRHKLRILSQRKTSNCFSPSPPPPPPSSGFYETQIPLHWRNFRIPPPTPSDRWWLASFIICCNDWFPVQNWRTLTIASQWFLMNVQIQSSL